MTTFGPRCLFETLAPDCLCAFHELRKHLAWGLRTGINASRYALVPDSERQVFYHLFKLSAYYTYSFSQVSAKERNQLFFLDYWVIVSQDMSCWWTLAASDYSSSFRSFSVSHLLTALCRPAQSNQDQHLALHFSSLPQPQLHAIDLSTSSVPNSHPTAHACPPSKPPWLPGPSHNYDCWSLSMEFFFTKWPKALFYVKSAADLRQCLEQCELPPFPSELCKLQKELRGLEMPILYNISHGGLMAETSS